LTSAPAPSRLLVWKLKEEAAMAVSAFLFVECAPDKVKSALARLRRVPGVSVAHGITGEYDLVAMIAARDVHILGKVVLEKVQSIPGVFKTTTNLVIE
jgi:Lrp/AsnC family transcriptional regulator for asnA, asnC and gidA